MDGFALMQQILGYLICAFLFISGFNDWICLDQFTAVLCDLITV